MTTPTPIIAVAVAAAVAVPMAANAAHVTHHKRVQTRSTSRTALTTPSLATPKSSYIQTSSSPNTFININACQLTGLCAPAVYLDTPAS